MKNKYIFSVLIFGGILTILGALLKITHFEFGFITGNLTLTIGMLLEAIALTIFVIKIVTNKNDGFLNK